MIRTDSYAGRLALMAAHCAGMVDLVALPVWVGALIEHYRLDPQQAGGLVTLFLLGAVVASLCCAPLLQRVPGRRVAWMGFGLATLAFLTLSRTSDYVAMAALHAFAGLSTGSALSFTHGTIGCSARPHRLFALMGAALGFFAVAFLALVPKFAEVHGGPRPFWSPRP